MSNRTSVIFAGSILSFLLTLALMFGERSSAQTINAGEGPDPEVILIQDDALTAAVSLSRLTKTPSKPIERDPNNLRYFKYGADTVALVGISGDYLPHVDLLKPGSTQMSDTTKKSRGDCGWHLLDFAPPATGQSTVRKYTQCIDEIAAAGLDKMRIFVGLNHSPGKAQEDGAPFPHEQPFKLVNGKWQLTIVNQISPFDDIYFDKLYAVIKYCQTKGVIVEVTLFDPFEGEDDGTSPWLAKNNNLSAQFSAYRFFAYGDKTTAYQFGPNELIDDTGVNKTMRAVQLSLMIHTVDVLNGRGRPAGLPNREPLFNFYWELANEPEYSYDPAMDQQLINWHNYMAKTLRDYEMSTYNRKHLIAVNYANQAPIDNTLTGPAKGYIDIIEAHYVRKRPGIEPSNPVPVMAPFGAMEMARKYNEYSAGMPTANNNKIWGFNENRYTFIPVGDSNPTTAESVRAEAWEFLFSGGGIYEHLSYFWGNLNPAYNAQVSLDARNALSKLNDFIWTISNFNRMKRSANWLVGQPAYGSTVDPNPPSTYASRNFWGAMNNGTRFIYYIHHSKYSSHPDSKYDPVKVTSSTNSGYRENLSVGNLGTAGYYEARWIKPSTGQPYNQVQRFCWISGQTQTLAPSPYYDFDIALSLQRISTVCNSTIEVRSIAAAINGSTVTASSIFSNSYPAEAVIDGDRTGNNWGFGGGWSDGTDGKYPDWIQVNFPEVKAISEIDVYTLRDDFANTTDPIWHQAFSLYGITDFQVQYRDPGTFEWVTIPDGDLTGNDRVWNQFIFDTIKTDAIRVVVNNSVVDKAGAFSRIVEIEAYQEPGS